MENEYVRIGCAVDDDISPRNLAGIYLQDKISGKEAYILLNHSSVNFSSCGWSPSQPNASTSGSIAIKDSGGTTIVLLTLFGDTQGVIFRMQQVTGNGGNKTVRFYKSNKELNSTLDYEDVYMPTDAFDQDWAGLKNTVLSTPRARQNLPEEGTLYTIKTVSVPNGVAGNVINVTRLQADNSFAGTISLTSGIYLSKPYGRITTRYWYRYRYQNGTLGPLNLAGTQTMYQECKCIIVDDACGGNYDCHTPLDTRQCGDIPEPLDVAQTFTVPVTESVDVEFLANTSIQSSLAGAVVTVDALCTENNKVPYVSTVVNALRALTTMRYPYAGVIANGLGVAWYFYDADGNSNGAPQANDYLHIKNSEIIFNNERADGTDVEESHAYILFSGSFSREKADRKAPLFDWAGSGNTTPGSGDSPHWETIGAGTFARLGRVDLEGSDKNTVAFILGNKPYKADGTSVYDPIKYGPHDISEEIVNSFIERDELLQNNETYNVEFIPRYYYDDEQEIDFLKNYSAILMWGTHMDDLINPCTRPCESGNTETTEDFFEDEPQNFTPTMENNIRAALSTGVGLVAANAATRSFIGLGNRSVPMTTLYPSCGSTACAYFVISTSQITNSSDNASSFTGLAEEGEGKINYHATRHVTNMSINANYTEADVTRAACSTDVGGLYATTLFPTGEDVNQIARFRGAYETITCSATNEITTAEAAVVAKTSILYNGSKYYTRIVGAGGLTRGGDAGFDGHILTSSAERELVDYVTYVKKKPAPSIDVGFTQGTYRRPLNASQDVNATVYNLGHTALRLVDSLRNLTSQNVTISPETGSGIYSGSVSVTLSGMNTTGYVIFNATNTTGKILKSTIHAWSILPAGTTITYQVSRDGRNYYAATLDKEEDFELFTSIAWVDTSSIVDATNSTLRVRAILETNSSGTTPILSDLSVDYVSRASPLASAPAKFWSHYNQDEDGPEILYHDANEVHVSNGSGTVVHSSANLGAVAGNYRLYVRFIDNRTFANDIYQDADAMKAYVVDKINFYITANNAYDDNLMLSAKENTRRIGNESIVLHLDQDDIDVPSEGNLQDSSGSQNNAVFEDVMDGMIVATIESSSTMNVTKWDGEKLSSAGSATIGSPIGGFTSADIDGDGDVEIIALHYRVVGFSEQEVSIYRSNGSAVALEGSSEAQPGFFAHPIGESTVHNINGDNRLDVLFLNSATNPHKLQAINWNGTRWNGIATSAQITSTSTGGVLGADDFDNDSKTEVVVYQKTGSTYNTTIHQYNGTGLQMVYNQSFNNGERPWAVYDMEGDGKKEILYLGNGRFIVADWNGSSLVTRGNVSSSCTMGDVGNIDGDNLTDIACQEGSNLSIYEWNNETQTLTLLATKSLAPYASNKFKEMKVGRIRKGSYDDIVLSLQEENPFTHPTGLFLYTYENASILPKSNITKSGFYYPRYIYIIRDRSVPEEVNGVFNTSFSFTETQEIIVPNASIPSNASWTISFWMQKKVSGKNQTLFSSKDAANGCDLKIWINTTDYLNVQTVNGNDCSSTKTVASPFPLDGRKMHIAYVGTNTGMQLYIDGILSASNSNDGRTKRGYPTFIGLRSHNLSFVDGFNGTIDEFRIYSTALNETSVRQIMHFPYISSTEFYLPGAMYNFTVRPYYVYDGSNLTQSEVESLNVTVYEHNVAWSNYSIEKNTSNDDMFLQGIVTSDGTINAVFSSRNISLSNPAQAGKRMLVIKAKDPLGISSDPLTTENHTDAFRVLLLMKNITFIESFGGSSSSTSIFNRGENMTVRTYFHNPNSQGGAFDYGGINVFNYTGKLTEDEAYNVNEQSLDSSYTVTEDLLGNYTVFATATDDSSPAYSGDGYSNYSYFNVTDNIVITIDSLPAPYFNRGDNFTTTFSLYNARGERYSPLSENLTINFTQNSIVEWQKNASIVDGTINNTGHVIVNSTVLESYTDTYLSVAPNNSAEFLDYRLVSKYLNNTARSFGVFDIDGNYYLNESIILFSTVMRGDTNQVNATFVNARNVSVPDGTNVSVRWHNTSNGIVSWQNMTTSSGAIAGYQYTLANQDPVGSWIVKFSIDPLASGNSNNSLAEVQGAGFQLNNTIGIQSLFVTILGETNTQRKIFNLNETINVSGRLLHADGGTFRIKSPSANTPRTITVQVFNTSYGFGYLENESILVSMIDGFFNTTILVNRTLNDTYTMAAANQSQQLDYDVRMYDGTANKTSASSGNDGNVTDQFDIDYNYYPAVSRTDGYDLYNRGETVHILCITYNARNLSVSDATTYFRAYNPANAVWFEDTNPVLSNGIGQSTNSFVLNRTSPAGYGWQSYCNATKDGNEGETREQTFSVSDAVNVTLYINDANSSAYLNADFNTGEEKDRIFTYAEVKNARGELTTQFDNMTVEHWFRQPYTLSTLERFNRTLAASNSGNYSNETLLTDYSYMTANSTHQVYSNDSNGNTNVTGLTIRSGKLHFLATNVSVNDTHILRTQSILYTLRAYDTFNDTIDNGIIDASAGFVTEAVDYNLTAYPDNTHTSPEFTYGVSGNSVATQSQYYSSQAQIDYRDVAVKANSSAVDLDGKIWNVLNTTAEPSLDDNQGVFAVDDLVISAIGFDRSRYVPPQTMNAIVSFNYFLPSFSSLTPANEFYDRVNATIRESDGETNHVGTYYNATSASLNRTDANGNMTFPFQLYAGAEAGNDWTFNASTHSEEQEGKFDVDLVVNSSSYFAHLNSDIAHAMIRTGIHNRNETVQANFTFENNRENKVLTAPALYDIGDAYSLNSSGLLLGTQGAEFRWTWLNNATAANTLQGTPHLISVQTTINGLLTNATANVLPNVSSLLLLDVHAQKSAVLSKDADPSTDGGNLRDNQSIKDSREDTTYLIGNDVINFWVHVQNVRGENLNVSVNSTQIQWKNPFGTVMDTYNATADNHSWSEYWTINPVSPSGLWSLLGLVNYRGNSGNDTQFITLGKLSESPVSLRCSQRASITGVLCTVSALLKSGEGFAEGQIMRYIIRNESYVNITSGTAGEIGNGIYTFTFYPPNPGSYLVYAYVLMGSGAVFSDTAAVYADRLNITDDQNYALNDSLSNFTTLDDVIQRPENFGDNNLTDIRERLEVLRKRLLDLRETSKEDVVLVTDSVIQVNNLIAKTEEGSITVQEAERKMNEIKAFVDRAQSDEVAGDVAFRGVSSSVWQYAVIGVLFIGTLILFRTYRRRKRLYAYGF